MKSFFNQSGSIVLGFIITLILNFGLELLFTKSGAIEISSLRISQESTQWLLRIENYTDKNIDKLEILVPQAINISNISSTTPVKLELSKTELSDKRFKSLIVSSIPPKIVSSIAIPLANTEPCCIPMNLEELKITDRSNRETFNPSLHALYKALQAAVIYAIFTAFIVIWHKSETKQLQEKIDGLSEKYEKGMVEAKERISDLKTDAAAIEKSYARRKAILIRRLNDYSSELAFWRDTVRKILYETYKSKEAANNLIGFVTKNLETHGTNSKAAEEYATIEALAKNISEFSAVTEKQKHVNSPV